MHSNLEKDAGHQMKTNFQWRAIGRIVLTAGLVVVATDSRKLLATDIASPATVNAGSDARLELNQTGDGVPPIKWTMNGNELAYTITDSATSVAAFGIEAGAPYATLHLHENGYVGIGTTNAQRELHIVGHNAPAIRLEQTNLGGYPARTWGLEANDLNFMIHDVTANRRAFKVQSGAPNDTVYLADDGSVGFGTSSPRTLGSTTIGGRFVTMRDNNGPARFVVQGTVAGELNLLHINGPSNQRNLRIRSEGGVSSFHVVNDTSSGYTVFNAIAIKMSNGNIGLQVAAPTRPLELKSGAHCTAGGAWTNASSRELKQDILPLTSEQAREAVQKLQPVGYRYKNELDEHYIGFIAEDVPDLVSTKDRKSLAAMDIAAVLTKVVQDQEQQLAFERERNTEQQKKLDLLTERLARLEQLMTTDVAKETSR